MYTFLAAILVWYLNALPERLFAEDYATVLLDKNDELLGAKIAKDGQWRFPESDSIPKKFETCILQFEDRNFYYHCGISFKGICRAVYQNIRHQQVKSGASTITMQTIRLMRKNPPRTFKEKIFEMILASRLECRYSKKKILNLYASHAPFGNNVVGLESASWRYFGRSSYRLSWAESATLAVLPNAPGLIYPGKNHERLLKKRNRLLLRLFAAGNIDSSTYRLAIEEPLPEKPFPLPQIAPHLLQYTIKHGQQGKLIHSTIDRNLQLQANRILQNHLERLSANQVFNGAILITAVKTGEVLAYVGNTNPADKLHANDVDCVQAARSTGSILKPILYEKCMESAHITPYSLVADIPCQYGQFSPKNYNKTYDGAVPANEALARSLNIPMVKLLNDYGLARFHNDLKNMGFRSVNKNASHYGLSLILGGAECSLWELNSLYTKMAKSLSYDTVSNIHLYNRQAFKDQPLQMDKACIYATFEAMTQLNRPDEEGNWKAFETSKKIAWKTGTSFGNRDAWAIGVTPDYVVSVWTGNADGEGRTGLVGIKTSAPVLFDLYAILPATQYWFHQPYSHMSQVVLCRESGCRASEFCEHKDTILIPATCLQTPSCNYHKSIFTDKSKTYRVDSDCEDIQNMITGNYMILPPLVEKYYKLNHPAFKTVPTYKSVSQSKLAEKSMALVYPKNDSKILIPIQLDETPGKTIFEATHKNSMTKIYWHIDDEYIGETAQIHQLAMNPAKGKHILKLIDEEGRSITCQFEVAGDP